MAKKNVEEYPEITKRKAFECYCDCSSLPEVSRIMKIPITTLKTWKQKFSWDRKIDNAVKDEAVRLTKNIDELDQIINSVEESENFNRIGKMDGMQLSQRIPSAMSDPIRSMRTVTDKDLDLITTKAWVLKEFVQLRVLEKIAEEALPKFKPKSMREVLEIFKFVNERNDKMISRLQNLNAKEQSQTESGLSYEAPEEMFFNNENNNEEEDY